jgi:predicted transposase YdaD
LRNDIIEVSLKHCIYLERFKAELTTEELSFMTYLQDVESAYQEWVRERRAEGKLEGKLEGIREGKMQIANKMVQAKFGNEAIAFPLSDRLAALTEAQLDELTTKIFEWQQIDRLLDWLNSLPPAQL